MLAVQTEELNQKNKFNEGKAEGIVEEKIEIATKMLIKKKDL